MKTRISALDSAKIFAITLVVSGHYIQNSDRNFDNNFFFKLIYSFHMPLFIMLSGLSAWTWLKTLETSLSVKSLSVTLVRRTFKSAITLYLPFISWAVFAYLVKPHDTPITTYLIDVIKFPDHGLWFLPCLFVCVLYISFAKFCLISTYKIFPRIGTSLGNKAYLLEFFIILLTWNKFKGILPRNYGFAFANYFHEGLFVYFLIGVYSGGFLQKLARRSWILPILIAIYLSFAPFWSRLEENSLSKNCPGIFKIKLFSEYFPFIVSMAGSLAVIFICFGISAAKLSSLDKSVTRIAGSTLGIYALHEYFLQRPIYILNSSVLSLFWVEIISRIPYLDTCMLGRIRSKRKGLST